MIDVRLYAHLMPETGGPPIAGGARPRAAASAGGAVSESTGAGAPPAPRSAEFQVKARPGLTVRDVVAEAGVRHKTCTSSCSTAFESTLTHPSPTETVWDSSRPSRVADRSP